ncbi:MAG: AsmA-like C-terminal region-containing protein [Pikeienuella sp.]
MTDERVSAQEGEQPAPDGDGTRSPDPYAGTNAPAPPMRKRGRKRHAFTRLLGGIFALLAIVLVLVVGGVTLKLRSGPLDISRMAPLLSEQLSAFVPGGSVKVDGATLAIEEDQPGALRIALRKFTFYNGKGQPLAQAPKVSGVFLISDIVRGDFEPSELVISDVSVAVRRLADGRLVVDAAMTGGNGGDIDGAALLALLGSPPDEGSEQTAEASEGQTTPDPSPIAPTGAGTPPAEVPATGLAAETAGATLALENVEFVYADDITGREWRAKNVVVNFASTNLGVQAVADIDVDGGRFGRQTLRVQGYRAASGSLYLDGEFSNVAVGDIASQITALEWLAPFDAPVAGRLKLALDDGGLVTAMSGSLNGGAGVFRVPGVTGQNAVSKILTAGLDFVFEPLSERFIVSSVRMDAERGRFDGDGLIELERNAEGELTGLVTQMTLRDVNAVAPELFAAPLAYDRADMTMRLNLEPLNVEVGDIRLERGNLVLAGAGVIRSAGEGFAADLILRGKGLTSADLLTHWPPQAAGNARKWVAENVISGRVEDVNASIRIGGRKDVVSLDFTFRDIESRYLADMPPVINGAGAGQLDLTAFHLTLTDGEVVVPLPPSTGDNGPAAGQNNAPLLLAGSSLSITGLDQPLEQMTVDLKATGPAKAMIAIIDEPPLSLISKLGAPIEVIAGEGDVQAAITFPLLKDLLVEDIAADATAALRDIEGVVGPERFGLQAKSIDIEASAERMALTMDGAVEGVGLRATWRENFSSGARSVRARGRVTPSVLRRFGVEQPWFSDGSIAANVTASLARGGYDIELDADITRAAISVADIGWQKEAGEAGRVKTAITLRDDQISLTGLSAQTGGYEVEGDVLITADGAPRALDLRRVVLPGMLDAAVRLDRVNGGWKTAVSGAYLDIPALRKRFGSGSQSSENAPDGALSVGEGGPKVDARIDLARVQLTDDIYIASANGAFALGSDVSADLSGLIGGIAPVKLRVTPEGADRALTLVSDDAGRLMHALGVFDDGAGGALEITATMPGGNLDAATGVLSVRGLTVHDDAKLERMLIGGELDELRAKMREDGLHFRKIIAPFIWKGDTLKIKNAIARGGDIGVTIDGLYHIAEERLDMKGVFTPLYGVNSALGNLPLIGKVLTGGKGEGIFALNYTVTGSASDPEVNVNPLSLLAPGILRKLVEGEGDTTPPVRADR